MPELASREHGRAIVPTVRAAMKSAGLQWQDISGIAVTTGPGLMGALLIGATYAKALSYSLQIPLLAVNHVEGHIHAVILEARGRGTPVAFPALALVVSGGHTHLFAVSERYEMTLLGRTRDDAAGEAFDKVGKLLGYGYPGGPVIDQLAPYGDARAVRFPRVKLAGNQLDFSFSGIKTAVLRWQEAQNMTEEIERRRSLVSPTLEAWLANTPQRTRDAIASFQETVIAELLARLRPGVEQIGARSVIVSGGVACNSGLRRALENVELSVPVHLPSRELATDNAVMIAAAGIPKLEYGDLAGLDTPVYAQLGFLNSGSASGA